MPRLRCSLKFPQAVGKGYWRIESPVGTKVYEESFENIATLSKELTVSPYSALVLVNSGVSMGVISPETTPTAVRYGRQEVKVVVTPGAMITMPTKFRTKPQASTSPGVVTTLHNKFRTAVSVSVS